MLTRESLTYTAAAGIALLDAASIADVATLAGSYANGVVERSTSGAARLMELGFELAEDVSAPLATRLETGPDETASTPAPPAAALAVSHRELTAPPGTPAGPLEWRGTTCGSGGLGPRTSTRLSAWAWRWSGT